MIDDTNVIDKQQRSKRSNHKIMEASNEVQITTKNYHGIDSTIQCTKMATQNTLYVCRGFFTQSDVWRESH